MTRITAGYDVGGAHLKVARVEDGRLTAVDQFPCALWNGLDELSAALNAASALTDGAHRHAITMTGELCELFATRHDGVVALTAHLSAALGPNVRFFLGLKNFGDAREATSQPADVASANFLATAKVIATLRPQALLIDMGSTTTDIIACDRPQGLSDAERLQTGELVYTGLTRTPVASVTTRAVLAGQWQSLARDAFATMADVRRVLGALPDDADQLPTADGRGKSLEESLARLARGFGRDAEMRHLPAWKTSAAFIREQQLRSIADGALQVLSRPGQPVTSVVAAGVGADEAAEIARRLGLSAITFGDLIAASNSARYPAGDPASDPANAHWHLNATRYAPAAAVALLADD